MSDWYRRETAEVLQQLQTQEMPGLSQELVQSRRVQYGPNELREQGARSPWRVLWDQLVSIMVVILIIAAIASAALGDYQDAAVILAIVVLNVALGFSQEYQAERAVEALKKLAVPTVRVRREGLVREVRASELVPGDIVLLEAGNIVPADGRVLASANLRVQEAALTGESEAVEKDVQTLATEEDLPLGDRRNMVYMGTVVVYGRGEMVVTETGMQTELGHIAGMLRRTVSGPTPLQKRLDRLGRALALLALLLVVIVFLLGLLRGVDLVVMFLTAVSMAVAAVPEGLPAVVTIALALGAQRLLRRHTLVRRLTSVETLGSVTVICSDKTGTITENRMTATVLDVADYRVDLTLQLPIVPRSKVVAEEQRQLSPLVKDQPTLALLMVAAALCNDALLQPDESEPGTFYPLGDPTEGALVVAAANLGLWKDDLQQVLPRIFEVPFDSVRKRMTTVHRFPRQQPDLSPALDALWLRARENDHVEAVAFTKGAVDGLLTVSSSVWMHGQVIRLDETWRNRAIEANNYLAREGMRVLGVAFRPLEQATDLDQNSVERDLIFVGMIGMIDPARPEVKEAIQVCKTAGIRPVMITGDHPLTAQRIARDMGMLAPGDRVLTGQELARLSQEELQEQAEKTSVYARVSPEHKLDIVEALQAHKHIVAMTGDGVNDAPALRKADIGVAMGISGTDVAKEAADMVLLDDNFATIVAAVEEGRVIYDNIRKFVKYIISANLFELLVMLIGPFLGMPLPLLPLQILWINLVTDGLPALALSVEPAERFVMRRPPYPSSESFFARGMIQDILAIGLLCGLVSLGVGFWYWLQHNAAWQTMIFTVLAFAQMFIALGVRSERDSLFRIGLWSNKALLGAILLTVALQLVVVYTPFLQHLFSTVPLSLGDLAIVLAVSTVPFWFIELKKLLVRRGLLRV
ncbi:MAG: cation-translocating P-type ATPase [Ktedonobacteraceae bacterium]|nr:cation-translocating P-type ATPase [Ktedonobacteraceae bacterium]